MAGETIFILAGYPASGKSSLLGAATRKRMQIFGPEHDRDFRASVRIKNFDETISSEAKIKDGMWLTLRDLDTLEKHPSHAPQIALHLDLLLLLMAMQQRGARFALDRDAVRRSFARFLSRPLFGLYPNIVANTLKPPLDVVARNWLARESERGPRRNDVLATKHVLIAKHPARAAIYDLIHAEWIAAIAPRALYSATSNYRPAVSVQPVGKSCFGPQQNKLNVYQPD